MSLKREIAFRGNAAQKPVLRPNGHDFAKTGDLNRFSKGAPAPVPHLPGRGRGSGTPISGVGANALAAAGIAASEADSVGCVG